RSKYAQHVGEAPRLAEVRYEQRRADGRAGRRGQPGVARKSALTGQVGHKAHESGRACQAADEEVGRHLPCPDRALEHGPARILRDVSPPPSLAPRSGAHRSTATWSDSAVATM